MKISRKQAAALGLDPNSTPKPRSGTPLAPPAHGTNPLMDALFLAHGIPAPRYEVEFVPGRRFKADMILEDWLIVERDGGLYGRGKACPVCKRRPPGAHSSIGQMKSDREKDRLAILHGYAIVRFLPEEFEDGSAFTIIHQILSGREDAP